MTDKKYGKTDVLIIGAGPAGLSAGIKIKTENPALQVCIIDKEPDPGNHNLSGAVLETATLKSLLDTAEPGWEEKKISREVLNPQITRDDIMFFVGEKFSFNIIAAIKAAKLLGLGFGQMIHKGDYSVSISELCRWLADIAERKGVEIITGFSAEDIIPADNGGVRGVKLVDQGRDREGSRQPNFVEGETIEADFVLLAEGCDGLVTEKFVEKAGLKRQSPQLFSVGVKELYKVSERQYEQFGAGRVVHAMGYPLWTPILGPGMFGGGIMYAGKDNHISVGMIVGADWKYYDFTPQQALDNFKKHRFVRRFIESGTLVEAGAKMIPEGGYYAIPRSKNGEIGSGNCMILGDSAGFVNMLKIKGIHNAVESGLLAGKAVIRNLSDPAAAAEYYTDLVEKGNVGKEMRSAKNFRQTVARFGNLIGMPLSVLDGLLPHFKVEEDYKATGQASYRYKPARDFDKDTFTAMAGTEHREDQPSHLQILDPDICTRHCRYKYKTPCIEFCPAGVYEMVNDKLEPANPSNCLHCKTCQRKCPYDNIRWTVPEGGGGPRYKRM